MLTLRQNSYDFDRCITNNYRSIDRNFTGPTTLFNTDFSRLSRIYRKDVACAFAPLVFNNIRMMTQSYGIQPMLENLDVCLEDIETKYNNLDTDEFGFIRVYAEDVEFLD